MKREIADKLIAIMADVDDLDQIKAFVRGVPYPPPRAHLWPFAEVVVTEDEDAGYASGNTYFRTYKGFIQFNVMLADFQELRDRVLAVPSYDLVEDLVDAAVTEFRKVASSSVPVPYWRTLEDLAAGDEVVKKFDVTSPRQYGIERKDERRDNFNNYGVVPFTVETTEIVST